MKERLCGSCDEPIHPKRVQAIPSCTLCVKCQEKSEDIPNAGLYVNTTNLACLRDGHEIPIRVTVGRVKNRLKESDQLVYRSNNFVLKSGGSE